MWWAILQIWPGRFEEAAWTALLFFLYPGFRQQFVSVNTSRHILPLAMLLFSFGFTARACRALTRRQFWIFSLLSTLLSTASMLTTDYYLSLEVIRPLVIWFLLDHSGSVWRQLRQVLRYWLPNLIPGIVVIIWRFFLTKQLYYPVDLPRLLAPKNLDVVNLFIRALQDLVTAVALEWERVFRITGYSQHLGSNSFLLYTAVVAGAGLVSLAYLYFLHRSERSKGPEKLVGRSSWWKPAVLVGLLALVAGAIPAWVTGLAIDNDFPQDRLFLPLMIGVSLILAGLLRAVPFRKVTIAIVAISLGLAAGRQLVIASDFRWDWDRQKTFFWQLAWRVPGLEPGTMILTDELPFDFETDNSLTAPFNWMYAPGNTSDHMSTIVFESSSRRWLDLSDPTSTNNVFTYVYREFAQYRTFSFTGSKAKTLIVYQNYPACLRVLEPFYDHFSDDYPRRLKSAFNLSDPKLIQTSPAQSARPPVEIFGPEPAHDWCYYFEKADLARQMGDWTQAAGYGKSALQALGASSPGHASEYDVFIEAFGRNNDLAEAERLTNRSVKLDQNLKRMLCMTWDRIDSSSSHSPENTAIIQRVRANLTCSKY